MSQKNAKKFRKLFRQTAGKRAEEMGKTIGNVMKPKWKFVPWWLWKLGLSIFIKIK